MTDKITPQSVIPDRIPDCWYGIYVTTDEELAFYGSSLLWLLIQYWQKVQKECIAEIKRMQEKIELLSGQTVETLKEEAAQWETPVFTEIGIRPGSWDYPEPLDAESIKRKWGTTTLNVCGWCKFAAGDGVGRHNYCIATTCSLIPPPCDIEDGHKEKFGFNTPCMLTNGSDKTIEDSINRFKAMRDDTQARYEIAAAKVSYLLDIVKTAEKKPLLSLHRPSDWFNTGDQVMCFIDFDEATVSGFISAPVVEGYKHHQGFVSVRAKTPIHNNLDNDEGCGLCFCIQRPEVLHEWEYNYLRAHPEFLKVWMRAVRAEMEQGFRTMQGFNPLLFESEIRAS
jgi:hypothetical protein